MCIHCKSHICKSLWIKASAKWLNVNVNDPIVVSDHFQHNFCRIDHSPVYPFHSMCGLSFFHAAHRVWSPISHWPHRSSVTGKCSAWALTRPSLKAFCGRGTPRFPSGPPFFPLQPFILAALLSQMAFQICLRTPTSCFLAGKRWEPCMPLTVLCVWELSHES